MPRWTNIIVHHSFTGDSVLPDTVAIRRFHTSYRQGGDIITAERYAELKAASVSGIVAPWKDVGYHWIVETLSDGRPWLIQGRSMMMVGAHCVEQGMNRRGIGLCVIGNYDAAPPPEQVFEKAADTVAWLCRMYRIPVENVQGHRDYATYKSCPGTKFDMDYFRERVIDYLSVWAPNG